ncbi:MAG: ABC transporter permease [Chloroflexi bacterium]|nr:ABC transporter permease [Chloroflexota bacterium]
MNSLLYLTDIIARISRNAFLVLSLIIPVVAGMGLNFSIVLGAMAAQALIIFVTHWGVTGFAGILLCAVLVTPLAALLGYLTGHLFNRTKGQEMITGLILGYFAAGWYQFIFLQLVGGIIPMNNPILVLSSGVGIRTTVDLTGGLKYGLDNVYRLRLPEMLIIVGVVGLLYQAYQLFRSSGDRRLTRSRLLSVALPVAVAVAGLLLLTSGSPLRNVRIPVATWLAIGGLCLLIHFLFKTKLGQDLRSVGQDRHVAQVSGIPVDQVRITAIVLSTVLAAWGHIIFLQNMGAFSTYGSYEQVGMYAIAAILIGGATVTKATIGQALLGVFLFHTLFIVAPAAGRELFGDAQVGEYFRVFVAYGVIGVTLAMHAWKSLLQRRQRRELEE